LDHINNGTAIFDLDYGFFMSITAGAKMTAPSVLYLCSLSSLGSQRLELSFGKLITCFLGFPGVAGYTFTECSYPGAQLTGNLTDPSNSEDQHHNHEDDQQFWCT
jgi:hypothetical protein